MVEEKVQSLEVSMTQVKGDLEHMRKDLDSIKASINSINKNLSYENLDNRYASKRIEKMIYGALGTLILILLSVIGFLIRFIISQGV